MYDLILINSTGPDFYSGCPGFESLIAHQRKAPEASLPGFFDFTNDLISVIRVDSFLDMATIEKGDVYAKSISPRLGVYTGR